MQHVRSRALQAICVIMGCIARCQNSPELRSEAREGIASRDEGLRVLGATIRWSDVGKSYQNVCRLWRDESKLRVDRGHCQGGDAWRGDSGATINVLVPEWFVQINPVQRLVGLRQVTLDAGPPSVVTQVPLFVGMGWWPFSGGEVDLRWMGRPVSLSVLLADSEYAMRRGDGDDECILEDVTRSDRLILRSNGGWRLSARHIRVGDEFVDLRVTAFQCVAGIQVPKAWVLARCSDEQDAETRVVMENFELMKAAPDTWNLVALLPEGSCVINADASVGKQVGRGGEDLMRVWGAWMFGLQRSAWRWGACGALTLVGALIGAMAWLSTSRRRKEH